MATLKELRDSRLEKLRRIRELGIDPYPAKSNKNIDNKIILENYKNNDGKVYTVAGRVESIRTHGGLCFIDLKDSTGKIQLYIKKDVIRKADYSKSELNFEDIDLLDTGDFIEGSGTVTKTKKGEISVEPYKIRLLTKSIRPMPDKWDGLKDKETRLRRRYLDTNINEDVYQRFIRRAKYWQAHRDFFQKNGFIEINIPVLEHTPGGADANPFTTHMDAIDQDFYLRISQELYLKRLVGGGYHKVYEIGPRFRNEGLSDEHLPEHIAMEFYWAFADYNMGMEFAEEMIKYTCNEVYGKLNFNIKGFEVDLSNKWEIIEYPKIIKDRFNIDIFNTNINEIKNALSKNKVKFDSKININRGIDTLWKQIRKTITGPAWMIHEPEFLSPLAKTNISAPGLTERVHPIIAGSELGNGFSELNDPLDQLDRFNEQQKLRDAGDSEAQFMDIDFVEMLEYGMPPTFGWGNSERNFWFFEDVPAREGVPFPQLRHEIDDVTKSIYPKLFKKTGENVSISDEDKKVAQDINSSSSSEYDKAQNLLNHFIKNEKLKIHCQNVEKCMLYYAKKLGEDEEAWAIAGLLHDIDWEKYPDSHPFTAEPILREAGYSDEIINAVLSHAYPKITDTPRKTTLDKYLFACDELSGFITAYSLMKGGIENVDVKGVKKKLKDKAFARGVDREDIRLGCEEIGLELDEHISNLLEAMK